MMEGSVDTTRTRVTLADATPPLEEVGAHMNLAVAGLPVVSPVEDVGAHMNLAVMGDVRRGACSPAG